MVFIDRKLLLICMSCRQYLVNVNALEVFSYCDFVESFKSISMKKNIINKTCDSYKRFICTWLKECVIVWSDLVHLEASGGSAAAPDDDEAGHVAGGQQALVVAEAHAQHRRRVSWVNVTLISKWMITS